MGRIPADLDERLLQAAATSHRRWFAVAESGNRLVDGGADVAGLVRAARDREPDRFGVWSLGRDDDLGVRLLARGFEWGWQPHWMGIELDREPQPPHDFEVVPATPPFARTLPFRDDASPPAEAIHLGVRLREKLIAQVVVMPGDDGVAGIYAMGVVPKVRRRGIGMALMRAALRAAWEHGFEAAVLNSTDEGEGLYRRAGFRSLGWGQTWWSIPGAKPSDRQVAITEAIGFGDLADLDSLAPSESEVSTPLPGGVVPLGLAALVGRADSVEHLLTRFPGLVAIRFPPHGGNLLHLAVEHDQPEVVGIALRQGVDPEARDSLYGGTPQGWAEHFGRAGLAELFRGA